MEETTLESIVRKLVAKIPANVYGVIIAVLAILDIIYVNKDALNLTLPKEVTVGLGIAHAVFIFLRPQSSSDKAVDVAAKEKVQGNELAATRIVETVVDAKAAKLAK